MSRAAPQRREAKATVESIKHNVVVLHNNIAEDDANRGDSLDAAAVRRVRFHWQ